MKRAPAHIFVVQQEFSFYIQFMNPLRMCILHTEHSLVNRGEIASGHGQYLSMYWCQSGIFSRGILELRHELLNPLCNLHPILCLIILVNEWSIIDETLLYVQEWTIYCILPLVSAM